MVIFGATGDFTKDLVVPALYNHARDQGAVGTVRVDRRGPLGGDCRKLARAPLRYAQSFVGNAAAEFDVDHIDEPVWKQLEEKMTYIARALRKASRRSRRNRKRRTAPKGTPSFISQKISFS
jgi:glucose-6-phosphate 1-dehydrogenase